jgi:hypothetical protein
MKKVDYQAHRNVSKPDGSTPASWFSYTCGHCSQKVSGATLCIVAPEPNCVLRWLNCPECGNPSVQDAEGVIHPGSLFGPVIQGLPPDVNSAYDEARRTMSVAGYTSCELICRKILMHVAVDKGAKEGQSFTTYIDHLEQQHYISPNMKKWVDLIRTNANESTHTLATPDKKRAESTLLFTAELLRIVYEMEHYASMYVP